MVGSNLKILSGSISFLLWQEFENEANNKIVKISLNGIVIFSYE